MRVDILPVKESHTKVFSIAAGEAFTDILARGVLARYADGKDWHLLAEVRILVPTRRAVQSVHDAFRRLARSSGQDAVLLPKVQPLGDVDEEELLIYGVQELGSPGHDLPPAISNLKRDIVLSRLIIEWSDLRQKAGLKIGTTDLSQALRLARDLGHFFDAFETEGVDPAALGDLVPQEYAELWQENLEFLRIVTEAWPKILKQDYGAVDGVKRRNLLLNGLAEKWREECPAHPIIAAGSTGSIPATANLMRVIAELPNGAAILPGLDREMDDKAWQAIEPSHPQFGMKELLRRLEIPREAVDAWQTTPQSQGQDTATARRRVIQASLRPAAATDDWRDVVEDFLPEDWQSAMQGLSRIDTANPAEEALVISLILRDCVAQAGRTAALVTPDRHLARRVAANMRRWEIDVNDSAGQPLSQTPVGVFLSLVVQAAHDDLEPVALLSLLKHPLCRMGSDRKRFRDLVWHFEKVCLRGPAPPRGAQGLFDRLSHALQSGAPSVSASVAAELEDLVHRLDQALTPLAKELEKSECKLSEVVRCHIQSAERLSGGLGEEVGRPLWSGDEGEAAALFLRSLLDETSSAPPLSGNDYSGVFDALLSGQVVRPKFGQHPRVSVWGPLEARLQKVDTVILGGLNEGVWPARIEIDPWLSRPMRQTLGLPLPERRIGLSAHDFAQLASLDQVFLTRSERIDGAPSVASRWLLRLETLLLGAGQQGLLDSGRKYLDWARSMNEPDDLRPWGPPVPKPPVAARPRQFSVTEIETWIRDPYAVYAKKILNLRALDPIATAPDRLQRGILIHQILDQFALRFPDRLPSNAYEELMAIGKDAFDSLADAPDVQSFWWPRFEHIAAWFAENEKTLREEQQVTFVHSETSGSLVLNGPGGEFILTARADRIDQRQNGTAIYDYKTGNPPSAAQVKSFLAPQLPLEALMCAEGGFAGIAQSMPSSLSYIRLRGGDDPGAVLDIAVDQAEVSELALEAKAGLTKLIAEFDQPDTPYLSQPRVQFKYAYSDYDHLARVKEWPTLSRADRESKT